MGHVALDVAADPPALVLLSQRRLGDAPLPYEVNDDRYRCLDCGESLILRQRRHATRFTSNFGHRGDADCTASATRRRETSEHLAGKEVLARWLQGQGIPARIEPGPFIGADGARAFRPDVLAWPDEPEAVSIEYQRSPLDIGESMAREAAYRAYAGPQRLHLWVFSVSPGAPHFASIGSIEVAGHDGRPRKHRRVIPTRDQLELSAAGAVVCWLDPVGEWLYVPYSGTQYLLDARDDELWAARGPESPAEWRAGYPRLDPAADWWALAPVPLRMSRISKDRTRLHVPGVDRAVQAVQQDEPVRERQRRAAARAQLQKAVAAHQAAVETERKAAAGRGERAVALWAERDALTTAAAHEKAAATAEDGAARAREESQRFYRTSRILAGQVRKSAVGLALHGRRRSSVQAEQEAALQAAQEQAALAEALQAEAETFRRAASEAHLAGRERRARRTLAALDSSWDRRLAAAMDLDVAEARRAVIAASAAMK